MIKKMNKDTYYKKLALDHRNGAKMKKCMAAIHLEADYDKVFWQNIFKHFFPGYAFHFIFQNNFNN
ncbi:hypothetical protein AGMMS49574_22030 [Bacteroidia bacterium]|nr:hypothetical protein AGMMS49574_22030 [Bacteroidia bacterium]